MNDETIVAIYDTPAHAELAAEDLREAGVPESAISIHTGAKTGVTATAQPREEGFWSSLFGGAPDHDTAVYDRSVDNGASVLTVETPETHVTRVLEIMESHQPIDIDDRAASYSKSSGAAALLAPQPSVSAIAPATRQNDGVTQLSEEKLTVGKRAVNLGGTRIRRYVIERPVAEDVKLHSEKIVVERRPVTDGRPAADSFSEKTIEMMETAEEAVVSKSAHVYEEVGLRKEVSDRVETIHDTVRKEEIEVEKVPASPSSPTPRI